MTGADVTLTGATDDVRGAGIGIYQDHDKVRIDIGGAERLLDMTGLSKLMTLLRDAALDARLWDLGRDAGRLVRCELVNAPAHDGPHPQLANCRHPIAEAGGRASCGHPADADGECSCSSWPERAPDRG